MQVNGSRRRPGGRSFRVIQQKSQNERRSADRFPIAREVRYKVLNKKNSDEIGAGQTVNMSSTGVYFTTEHILLPGRRLELAISWPAQLNNQTALKLVARGRIIRYDEGRAAMEIQQYEFRTAKNAVA
ncbi:MAG: PilZ domain-containing protein [Acidobacteriota bacterium]